MLTFHLVDDSSTENRFTSCYLVALDFYGIPRHFAVLSLFHHDRMRIRDLPNQTGAAPPADNLVHSLGITEYTPFWSLFLVFIVCRSVWAYSSNRIDQLKEHAACCRRRRRRRCCCCCCVCCYILKVHIYTGVTERVHILPDEYILPAKFWKKIPGTLTSLYGFFGRGPGYVSV